MSGRKQHYIPRHFLKEFIIPDGRDKLWMYRRNNSEPVLVSRSDAAAMRDFYSKPAVTEVPTLDDRITEYENELRLKVEMARSVPAGDILPAHLIGEIIVHLTMRVPYLGEFINAGTSEFVSSVNNLIHRPTEILESIEFPKQRVPLEIERIALKQLEQQPFYLLTNVTPKAIVRQLYQMIREDPDLLRQPALSEFSALLKLLEEKFKMLSKKIHIQVLEQDLVPASRKAKLEEFYWKVVGFPFGDAILPDCVAIAEDVDGWGPYMLAEHNSMTRIIIPLSSAKLAVGSVANDQVEVTGIYNQTAHECCFTFYLMNRKKEVPKAHLAKLGDPVRVKVADIISSALSEAVDEFIGDSTNVSQEEMQPVTWSDLSADEDFSYSVVLNDFGDEAYEQRVTEILKIVIEVFEDKFIPIHRLDGITFAVDYAEALQKLDRGPGVNRGIAPSAGANPDSVAMPIAVRRDDSIKTHIVIRDNLAQQLISEDETQLRMAIPVIYQCLGFAAFNALLEGKFPGTLLSPHVDPYEDWLFKYNDALLATYFSISLLTADNEMLEFYDELVITQLNQVPSTIIDAHAQYQADNDYERFFGTCAVCVSGFMTAMTKYLAARAAAIGPHRPEGLLDETLAQFQLLKWSKLFEKDLAEFNRRLEDWTILDEMYFLNRHFERLLFEVGIFPDQLTDGSLIVSHL